ncbi:MAG TPA: hypothetical protein VLC95_12780 [Anaerolineae bacterium]|nr:hypothetical protein [Anaerolineae bacterium]
MMFEKRIEIQDAQQLTLVDMAGNVTLEGWDERAVLVRLRDGEEEELIVEQGEAGPAITARNNVEIRLPSDLKVKARNVRGNMAADGLTELDAEQVRGNLSLDTASRVAVTEVYGNLKVDSVESLRVPGTVYGSARLKSVAQADVQNVRGDLVIKGTGRVRATRVGGNLVAKHSETIDADEIGGNAFLKDVAGPVSIDSVAGNLAAKNLMGGARFPRVGGNVSVGGPLAAAKSYHFRADGNAVVRVTEGTGADATVRAGGELLAPADWHVNKEGPGRWTGILAGGGAELVVEADGNVILGNDREWTVDIDIDEGFTYQAQEVARQVEEAMRGVDFEAIGQQVSGEIEEAMSRLRVKLEGVDWERMGHRTQEAIDRAMSRMQQDMDRMADRAARYQEKAARQQARAAERQARAEARIARHTERQATAARTDAWAEEMDAEAGRPDGRQEAAGSPDAWSDEAMDAQAGGPGLDEERLSILRMVEQGQISAQDAEMLLDALE